MSDAREEFARLLECELANGYDVVRIARAAFRMYAGNARAFDANLTDKVFEIVVMEEGPEFELSESEFRDFIRRLRDE